MSEPLTLCFIKRFKTEYIRFSRNSETAGASDSPQSHSRAKNSARSRRTLVRKPVYDFLFGNVVLKRNTLKETDPDSLSRPLTSNALNY